MASNTLFFVLLVDIPKSVLYRADIKSMVELRHVSLPANNLQAISSGSLKTLSNLVADKIMGDCARELQENLPIVLSGPGFLRRSMRERLGSERCAHDGFSTHRASSPQVLHQEGLLAYARHIEQRGSERAPIQTQSV